MRSRITMLVSTLVVVSMLITGCAPVSTYPPVQGTRGVTNGHLQPLPDIMVEALRYTYEKHGDGESFVINLPQPAEPNLYERISKRLSHHVDVPIRPMTNPGEPAFTIQQVRSRGNLAHVDVVYPGESGSLESATYTMKFEFVGGYFVDHVRVWRVPVETPPANYLTHTGGAADVTSTNTETAAVPTYE
ncbi:MAG: hypothetical protein AAF432_00955 [Planctomycetota bacterium]